jgi:hypothetical protein
MYQPLPAAGLPSSPPAASPSYSYGPSPMLFSATSPWNFFLFLPFSSSFPLHLSSIIVFNFRLLLLGLPSDQPVAHFSLHHSPFSTSLTKS